MGVPLHLRTGIVGAAEAPHKCKSVFLKGIV